MDESRWEHALNETKGLGDWRRDFTVLGAVAAVVFVGLRLFAPGSLGGNLLYSLLVGFGVLVLLPLFELLQNYRRAPKTPLEGEIARAEPAVAELPEEHDLEVGPAEQEPVQEQEQAQEPTREQQQERYRSLRERLLRARREPQERQRPG